MGAQPERIATGILHWTTEFWRSSGNIPPLALRTRTNQSNQFPAAHKAAIRRILARSDSLPMLRSLLLFALVAAAIGAFWYGMGRPVPMPPSPLAEGRRLNCISYAPFHGEQGPFTPALDSFGCRDRGRSGAPVAAHLLRPHLLRRQGAREDHEACRASQSEGAAGDLARARTAPRTGARSRRRCTLARRYPGVVEAFIVGNEALAAWRALPRAHQGLSRGGAPARRLARDLCRCVGVLAEGA